MSDRPPFMKLFVKDYDHKTMHLTLAEDGAYMRLIRLQWTTADGTLPNDHNWLRRKMRVPQDEYDRVVAPVIEEFFLTKGNRLFNSKCKEVFDEAIEEISSKSKAGKMGAEAKRLKLLEKDTSSRKVLPQAERKHRSPSATSKTEAEVQQSHKQTASTAERPLKQPEPEPEPEYSDTNVSATNAIFDTIKDKVWGEGVPYLTSKTVPDKKARQMIGKWLKTFTPEQVDHALQEAGRANTGDPVPYIIRVLTSSDAEHSPDFIKFWAKYPESPNKTDREQTARAFAAVLAGDDPPTVDQLCAAARAVTADDPKFIPSPRRWLEGRRWEAAARSEVHPFPGHPVLGQLRATKTAYAAARTYFDNHPDEEADHQAGLATLRKIYGGVI